MKLIMLLLTCGLLTSCTQLDRVAVATTRPSTQTKVIEESVPAVVDIVAPGWGLIIRDAIALAGIVASGYLAIRGGKYKEAIQLAAEAGDLSADTVKQMHPAAQSVAIVASSTATKLDEHFGEVEDVA